MVVLCDTWSIVGSNKLSSRHTNGRLEDTCMGLCDAASGELCVSWVKGRKDVVRPCKWAEVMTCIGAGDVAVGQEGA